MSGSKILLAGHWAWDIYEEALAAGFTANGCSVIPFRLGQYLPAGRMARLQAALRVGPHIAAVNGALLAAVERERPDFVLLNCPDVVLPATIRSLKERLPGTIVAIYHNDNPFVGWRNRVKWHHYLRCVAQCDLTLVYRPANVDQARRWGAREAFVVPPYYLSHVHRPPAGAPPPPSCDVVFIGHCEADGRMAVLDHLAKNGVQVRVLGTGWAGPARRYPWLASQKIERVGGQEYVRQLRSAKIALVFLSRANRDVWTRRCFEIPACGAFMMAPRTPELEATFADGREAVYFDSQEDLLQKVRYYLEHDAELRRIAQAGSVRCIESGHSEVGRARQILDLMMTRRNADLDKWTEVRPNRPTPLRRRRI